MLMHNSLQWFYMITSQIIVLVCFGHLLDFNKFYRMPDTILSGRQTYPLARLESHSSMMATIGPIGSCHVCRAASVVRTCINYYKLVLLFWLWINQEAIMVFHGISSDFHFPGTTSAAATWTASRVHLCLGRLAPVSTGFGMQLRRIAT